MCFSRHLVLILSCMAWAASLCSANAAEPAQRIRVGLIGLDTSHVIAYTNTLNDPKAADDLAGVTVVAGYPGGSQDIPASRDRLKLFTDQLRGKGIEIVASIDELLKRVDAIMLESVDGRPHLAQARPVIAAGKPLFIDKPMAGSLADVIQIFRLAQEKNVPCFSSSALRYEPAYQAVRNGTAGFGEVRKCTAWGPMHLEPHHPDLFWYGIHGVESLFTIMGTGCQTVTRAGPEKVVGQWKNGRQGTYIGKNGYGAAVEGTLKSGDVGGKPEGHRPLMVEIVKFFRTGKPPVSAEETIEIFAFMEAADESKRQGGAAVSLDSVMQKAEQQIAKNETSN